jgi:hypothetical protein
MTETFTDKPNVTNAGKSFILGVDLAQASDFTAIIAMEVEWADSGKTRAWGDKYSHDALRIVHIERFRDRLYPDVAERIRELKAEPRLRGATYHRQRCVWTESYPEVIVDRTGVGRPVCDLLKQSGVSHKAVTITAGSHESVGNGGYNVPKQNLVSNLQVALSTGRLQIAKGLELGETLREELYNFKLKVNVATTNVSYEAWREGEHDDLVLAAALAAWGADSRRKHRAVFY